MTAAAMVQYSTVNQLNVTFEMADGERRCGTSARRVSAPRGTSVVLAGIVGIILPAPRGAGGAVLAVQTDMDGVCCSSVSLSKEGCRVSCCLRAS